MSAAEPWIRGNGGPGGVGGGCSARGAEYRALQSQDVGEIGALSHARKNSAMWAEVNPRRRS